MKYFNLFILISLFLGCSTTGFSEKPKESNRLPVEIGFIDISLFGTSINEPIKILEKGDQIPKEYRPIVVVLDHNASAYYAAQVYYRKELGYDFILNSVSMKYNIKFKTPNNNFTYGRSEKLGFSMQVHEEDEGIRVGYIFFRELDRKEYNALLSDALEKVGAPELIPALTNKDIEKEKRVEEKEYSFDGIWKNKEEDDFGLIIQKAGDKKYSVSFFGPGGRTKPGKIPNSAILDDKKYKVISSDKIYLRGTNGVYIEYHKIKNIDATEAEKIKQNHL